MTAKVGKIFITNYSSNNIGFLTKREIRRKGSGRLSTGKDDLSMGFYLQTSLANCKIPIDLSKEYRVTGNF